MNKHIWELGKHFRWYHWAGGVAATGAMNFGILGVLGLGYKRYYADHEEQLQKFHQKYGWPTEQQRLELFAWLAPVYDSRVGVKEQSGADIYRRELLDVARGDVLEVAVGTGRCFSALQKSGEVKSYVGIDSLQEVLDVAKAKLADQPFPAQVLQADAHRLPFADASFDTVVGSLCLSSVEHPDVALAEMARVCRQDGQVLVLDCGLADSRIIRAGQAYLGIVPNLRHAWDFGWYDDRDPAALVAGCPRLTLLRKKTRAMGNWYLLTAAPVQE
mmetsp:Transcript_17835/g.39102  ORF Transcript_17835/g.39102 Transcript_17835/m.39102 type:complete len:273 (-) Transcript_17835:126-944(-)|eukprot:CAMPEP_0170615138 /NCGR_PEP_ID=MMETSP0224-20130122/25175_1 /TAXON_ID=285029 /ORGANISM="Togula jolla, Strain CCCM 725" /LENGTH=272 /DNA_ID=CAMNT_0010940845 /DNA_START=54 /DNA_END=872 /DNA_ORIENTATION=-